MIGIGNVNVKDSVVIIVLYSVLAPFLIGCETSPPTLGVNSPLTPAVRQSAQHELKMAWRLYERNEYHQTITKVQHILERYPDSRVSTEAKYLLGLSYYYIDGYPDAVTLFVDYLAEAPEGQYAENCSRLVQHIAIAYEKKYPSDERIRAQLALVDQELNSTSSLPLKLKRADLNWQLARYDKAGKLYSDLFEEYPAIGNDVLFNRRIELHSDNTYTVLTPSLMYQREINENPIVVRNVHSFRTSGGRYQHPKKYYVVTGEVTNRSNEAIDGVELFTTLYGFGHIVYDTHSHNIGQVKPGDTRAFSLRFQNFDNIDAVSYHESKVSYQR